jgi:hypothetical protein
VKDDTEETEENAAAERKARRLLWWATVLAFVAIAVCGLDIMIKNQILAQARESGEWLAEGRRGVDELRRDLASRSAGQDTGTGPAGSPAGDAGGAELAGVDRVHAGAQQDTGPDAGL